MRKSLSFIVFTFSVLKIGLTQNSSCLNVFLGYDSTYTKTIDTLHYEVFSICKTSNTIKEWHIYKKQFPNDTPDGPYKIFQDSQIIEEGIYSNGKHIRNIIKYHSTGLIKQLIQILNDSTTFEMTFFESGSIRNSGTYLLGKKNGIWQYFYSDGNLERIESYKQIRIDKDNRDELLNTYGVLTYYSVEIKEGIWKYYSQDRKLLKEEMYKNNTLINN